MGHFVHPCFPRKENSRTGILNIETGEWELYQGNVEGWDEITDDIEVFLAKIRRSHELRHSLGIPVMAYHAYGFPFKGYDKNHIRNVVKWARSHDMEVRIWVVEQSALLLIVVADPDTSEDSGLALWHYVRLSAPSYQSYGLSSWFEFCQFGTPIHNDWHIVERDDNLFASSPDGKLIVMFG